MLNLKFAIRMLRKTPFVTAVAIVSLALGIGANAAIFSLFNQILLRPLPVPEPSQLVNLGAPGPKPGSNSCGRAGGCDWVFSYPMFRDLERAQTVFTGIGAYIEADANVATRGQTEHTSALLVSGSYFPVLGVKPAIGRLLSPDDDKAPGQSPVVVLNHAYWQRRFGLDPGIVGQTLIVNGVSMTVVGVAERGFDGTTIGGKPDVFAPITMLGFTQPSKEWENRRAYWAYLVARLKPGVTIEQAKTALAAPYHNILVDVEAPLQRGMSAPTLERFKAKTLTLEPGARGLSEMATDSKGPLTLLFGVTAFVLLIACANIANLLLARGASRAAEMAVRLSIGAGRWQLVRQLLLESCLLALIGGLAGLLVAQWTLNAIGAILPKDTVDAVSLQIDPAMIAFAAVLALGTGVLFGLFPALHSTRPDLASTIKGTAGQPSGARAASRFRVTLATAQIALSMALLAAAGLFAKSLLNVSKVQLGLEAENVVMFSVSPGLNGYTAEKSRQLFERIEDRLAALPGVTGVTSGTITLLSNSNWGTGVVVEGFEAGPDTNTNSNTNMVGPGYFQTLGMTLIAGRGFTRADTMGSPKVAVVNEAFAKKFNLGSNPIGKHMGEGRNPKLDTEIVGFIRDAKYSDVKRAIPPQFFRPYRQTERVGDLTFYVRTTANPVPFMANISKAVAELDPQLPIENLRTLPQQIQQNVFMDRFISMLSAAFAFLATLLAAIGLYGVLAYTVAQRTREFGVRMALGAAPERVRAMVLGQVGVMTLVGGVIGLAAAVALGKLSESLLFQLRGWDPMVLAGAAVVLTAVALGAGFIPALRASRVEPMRALRYE